MAYQPSEQLRLERNSAKHSVSQPHAKSSMKSAASSFIRVKLRLRHHRQALYLHPHLHLHLHLQLHLYLDRNSAQGLDPALPTQHQKKNLEPHHPVALNLSAASRSPDQTSVLCAAQAESRSGALMVPHQASPC
jgi:hypothetical protein